MQKLFEINKVNKIREEETIELPFFSQVECPECGIKFDDCNTACSMDCDRPVIHTWHDSPERDCYGCNREDNYICPNCGIEF